MDFTGSFIYLFTVLDNMFLTAVRHEVNNLESNAVIQELELAINLALLRFLLSSGNQYNRLWVNYFEKVINYLQLHLKLFN